MEFVSVFLEKLAMYMLPPLAALLAGWIVAQTKLLLAKAKAMNPTLMEQVEWVAKMVVQAAEQAGIAGLIEDKKVWAVEQAEKMLLAQGLKVDLDVIATAIEAAVWSEINSKPLAVE
mgnify:CR=1 FL=1